MNRAKRFNIVISVLFVLISLLILGVTSASYVYLLNKSSSIAEDKYYAEMLSEKETILSELQNRYEKVKEDIVFINNTLPEEKESSELISDINSLSDKSGLEFISVKAQTTSSKKTSSDKSLLQTEKGKYSYEMPLIIEVKGPYGNFVSFIKSVENYQRLINITSIDLQRSDDGATSDEIEAILKLIVYLKK